MMPYCFWKGCKNVAEVNIGKIFGEDKDSFGNKVGDTVYLCKKHADKLWKKLEMGPYGSEE